MNNTENVYVYVTLSGLGFLLMKYKVPLPFSAVVLFKQSFLIVFAFILKMAKMGLFPEEIFSVFPDNLLDH